MKASQLYRIGNKKQRLAKPVLVLLLWLAFFAANAQTYVLPDSNFRKKLISAYPAVMSGNKLNIAAAALLTGTLDVQNANISDLSGIEYFTGITTLNASYNNITKLDGIKGLGNLVYLFMNFNKLASLPSISALTNLMDLQVAYNELTSLPDFTGLTNLKVIYCSNNQITALPDISFLTGLNKLIIGGNPYKSLPSFSPFINLAELHVHATGIDTIKGLSSLTNLKVLYAWGNKIRDLSGINANTKLNTFVVFDNELKTLPTLTNKPLSYVSINENFLTFEDLLPLTGMTNFNFFDYTPQKPFCASTTSIVREKDNFVLNANIDTKVTSNWYKWYKNGVLLDSNQTGIRNFASITYADSGAYTIKVTNSSVPGLTLESNILRILVKPCLEILNATPQVVASDAREGSDISFSSANLGGGVGPYSYMLISSYTRDTLTSTSGSFTHTLPGPYILSVTDSRMCKAVSTVFVAKVPGTEPVFSPDGDGIMDTYFIEQSGKARIYDTQRNLVKELNIPAVWDGTKQDGSPADVGYYAIVINGQKVLHVSLMR